MSRVASSVRSILASMLLTALAAVPMASAQEQPAGESGVPGVGSVNFVLAYKGLSEDWNLDSGTGTAYQPALGLEMTWGQKNWPVHIALDVLHSYDDGITHVPPFFTVPAYDVRLRASTLEIGLGVRRALDLAGWCPYAGAGFNWVRGNIEIEVSDPNAGQFGATTGVGRARSSAFGYWLGGGMIRRLGPSFQLGASLRFSKATLPAEPLLVESGALPAGATEFPEVDGGGTTIQVVAGWSFPAR